MNCSKNKTSELHSVVFKTDPPNRWTTETARQWLDDHNIKRLKSVDKTKNSLRYRIVDPACFVSFSTEVVKSEMGIINLVIGWYKKKKDNLDILNLKKNKTNLNKKKMNLNRSSKVLKTKGQVIFSSRRRR